MKDAQKANLQAPSYQYQVELIRQKTLWYWVFNKILGMSKSLSAKWANKLMDWRVIGLICFLGAAILFTIATFGENMNGATDISLLIAEIFFIIAACFNTNKNYFHFKKFSFGVLWKLYNFIICAIAVWINDKENKVDTFNETKTEIEGHVINALNLVGWGTAALGVSLLPGLFVNNRAKIVITIVFAIHFIYRGVFCYFDTGYDSTITIFNQKVSMRNQIVNRSMDLALWFSCQAYQAWKHPNCFFVTSKLDIKWIQN